MTNDARGGLLRDIVESLERAGHKLVVLRGYRGYPEHVGSDVDAVFDAPARLPEILSREGVATVVQVFEHETTFYYLYRWSDGRPVFINLDLSLDYGYRGRVFFRGEEFFGNNRRFKFFRVPTPDLEFVSYLLRKVAQGSVGDRQARRLTELYKEDPEGSSRLLSRFFAAETDLISSAAQTGEWEPVRARLKELRRNLLGRLDREQPLRAALYWLGGVRRRVERLLRPPGLMIAFLGTDGAGKSTVMKRVEEDLGPVFWDKRRYHKRPLSSPFRWTRRYGLRPPGAARRRAANKATGGVSGGESLGFNPHALPSRGIAYSLVKLGFWWWDFVVLGYAIEIYPRLTRPALLMFDRYYQDLLVDPRRYHYGGPLWLARLVGRFIPRPHLTFLLDAPPEILHGRKKELPLEEVARQREAFSELVRKLPDGHIVDTSRPLDESVAEIEQIILDYMANRVVRKISI